MDKKNSKQYLTWVLVVLAVAFALAGWYYSGGVQKMEGFLSGSDNNPEGSCSLSSEPGTCG